MSFKKILAIKLRSMGDTVLMTAPLQVLRQNFPEAQIDALVPESWASLLENHPAVSRSLPWRERHGIGKLLGVPGAALGLRSQGYDCILNFHASPSSAWIARASGARTRSIHFHGHDDANRFSTREVPGKGTLKPIIERDLDTVRALGVHVPAGRMPQVFLSEEESALASEKVAPLRGSGPLLSLGLGASRATKSWPLSRFAAVAVDWCDRENGGVFAVVGPSEESLLHSFFKEVDELVHAISDPRKRSLIRSRITGAHLLSLRELAALLSESDVFLGNDSGPKHLAVSVGTPTVTVFGPEHPFEWHPYPQERHPYFFIENLSCRRDGKPGMPPWCAVQECVIEEHKCMKQIGVEAVLSACQKVLRLK